MKSVGIIISFSNRHKHHFKDLQAKNGYFKIWIEYIHWLVAAESITLNKVPLLH